MTKKRPNKATRDKMSRMVERCLICDEPTAKDLCEFHQNACELVGEHKFYESWGIRKRNCLIELWRDYNEKST